MGQFSLLVSYFGYANHQSDSLWDEITSTLISSVTPLTGEQYADIMAGFGNAQRGSNQLWDHLIENFLAENSKEKISQNSQILALKSLLVVDVYDKRICDVMARELLNKENLENAVKNFFDFFDFFLGFAGLFL